MAIGANYSEAAECCSSCGRSMAGEHICYFHRARVCTDCHTDLERSERYEMDEWEREWRQGDRVPAPVVAVMVAVFVVTILACWRWL